MKQITKTIKQINLLIVMLTAMAFSSVAQYTLTDTDVVVTNGVIESCNYDFTIKDIIIPETLDGQTVTGIGDDYSNLFLGKSITSVQLPATIEYIGSYTFYENNLTSLTIPNSVTSIGRFAFYSNNITNLTIPNSVISIGASAFYGNNLSSIIFEANSNIGGIGSDAFGGNSGLTSITLPTNAHSSFTEYTDGNSNTYNEGDAITDFETNYYLNIPYTLTDDDVAVTNGVIESCSYSFNLKVIILPETLDGQTVIGIGDDYSNLFRDKDIVSVQLPSTIEFIGEGAFYNNNLTSVSIPNRVTYVGSFAFHSNNLTSVSIPKNVTSIGSNAFSYNNLTSVTFEANSNIDEISRNVFSENSSLTQITLPTNANSNFTEYTDGNGNTYNEGDAITDFTTNYYTHTHTLTNVDVVVTNGIIESCRYDFAYTNIIIPETLDGQTVTSIGYNLFLYEDITSVQLPSTLETIGKQAFYNNSLNTVTIPNSVTSIGSFAFYDNNLTNVTISNSVTNIGEYAFYSNNLSAVTFEANSSIIVINNNTFNENSSLTQITLPTNTHPNFTGYTDGYSNTYAEGDAITDFETVYYLNIPYTLTNDDVVITNGVIESCSYNFAIKVIIIPEILDGQTVIGIGDDHSNLFFDKDIVSIKLPATLKYISSNAFNQNKLTSITIPNNVTSIGSYAFFSNNLTTVNIPNSVININNRAFKTNNLTSVTFEDNSNIISIGNRAFLDNTDLTSITLPTNVNPNFTEYTDSYSNTYAEGDAITNFETNYYLDIPYTITDDDVVITNGLIESCSYSFAFKVIIIPETLDEQTVTGIGNDYPNLFSGKDIASVQLPATLESIGYAAFYSNNLTSITIPNSVTSIGSFAFYSNNLNSVTFEANSNIVNIDAYAFLNNENLPSITLPTPVYDNCVFNYWTDDNNSQYAGGTTVTDFYTSYNANLTCQNVDLSFTVSSTTDLIEGADVFVENIGTLTTDISGKVIFTSVSPTTSNFNYTISSNCYNTETGTVYVGAKDENITVTLTPLYSSADTLTICEGTLPYNYNGHILPIGMQSKDSLLAFTSITGCDSLVTLTVIINPVYNETDEATICNGDTYTFGTQTLTSAGDYTEIFTSITGCDSTVTLTLNVNPVYDQTDALILCASELPYDYYGHELPVEMVSKDTVLLFTSVTGCDSVVTLTLNVNPTYTETDAASICDGDSYTFGTQTLTVAGDYTETFQSITGCDSVVTLTLNVNSVYNETDELTLSANELPYNYYGHTLPVSMVSKDTVFLFTSISGCDSTVTLSLAINYSVTFTITDGENALEDATVTLFGYNEVTTDANGKATIEDIAPVDSIQYIISKDNYLDVVEYISVSNKNISIDTLLRLRINTVYFEISDTANNPIEGANITINEETLVTDINGETFIDSVFNGQYNYYVSKEGYNVSSGAIILSDDKETTETVTLYKENPYSNAIIFTITNGSSPIEGAKLTCYGSDYNSDSDGKVVVEDLPEGDYEYIVSANGYENYSAIAEHRNGHTEIAIKLTEVKLYTVTFNISGNIAVKTTLTATVTFNGIDYTTTDGVAIINNIENGTYGYSVTAEGYESVTDTVIIANTDVIENVVLTPVGLNDILNNNNIKVYPNPATSIINIESDNILGSVSIINRMGQIVYLNDDLKMNKNIQIDISDYKQGLYIIKTVNNGNVNFSQIVVE